MFASYRISEGEESARRFAGSFFVLSTAVSLICAAAAAAGAPLLVRILAPGFTGEAQFTAIRLVRIMSLAIVFFGLGGGLRGLLQSHRYFIIPELARVAYNGCLFLFAWFLAQKFGVLVLAWGIVCGAMVQLLIQVWGSLKTGALHVVWSVDHPGIRRAAGQLLPFILAIAGIKIIFVIDRIVASGLAQGDVAALNYASRLILLPVGLFALPLRTTLYPSLANLVAQNQPHKVGELLLSGLRMLLFIVVPTCVGLAVLHVPLTQLFFERGAFDHAATVATGRAVVAYAFGVPAIGMIFLLNNIFLSLNTPFTLVKINVFSWLINLGCSLLFSRYWGHFGVALGTSVSVSLTMALMIFTLKKGHLPQFEVKRLMFAGLKISFVSVLMGLLLIALRTMFAQAWAMPSFLILFLQLCLLGTAGLLAYILFGLLFRLDDWSTMKTAFRKL
jgi:putative peptidoglycan lipid II flippase